MDLIYANSNMEDIGVLQDYEFDLAYGTDENNFECTVNSNNNCCEAGYYLYIEGTEYGGIIDAIESDTASGDITYCGRTWHGILDSKVLCPDTGQDYITLSGDVNTAIASLLQRMNLSALFSTDTSLSGLTINNYKMDRYITGYKGITKMLSTVNAKLCLEHINNKVIISAKPVVDYSQSGDLNSDLVDFKAKLTSIKVNHLICLGQGNLKDRTVIHLYADKNGNISQTQSQFGVDEYTTVYDYSNVENTQELIDSGTERLKELIEQDTLSVDFNDTDAVFDVGDIVGAYDNITGISVFVPITKKIVNIKNNVVSIEYKTDGTSTSTGSLSSGTQNSEGVLNNPQINSGILISPQIINGITPNYYYSNNDNDETALNAWLDKLLNNMPNNSIQPVTISCYPAVSDYLYQGFIFKNSNDYASLSLRSYSNTTMEKVKFNGVWGNVRIIPTMIGASAYAVDYVTEQGTSGVWTYRKWESGNIELHGHYSQGYINCDRAYGSVYISQMLHIALPSIDFTIKSVSISVDLMGGIGGVCIANNNDYSVGQINYFIWHATSRSNFSPVLDVYITGTWK